LAVEAKPKYLEAIEFLTGFGWGKLREKDNYNLYPLVADFDFNLKPLTQKLNFNPRSLLQFQIEPFISGVSSPNANVEVGTSFFLKVGVLPQTSKFQPYIKAGVGMDYMTQHTREQATQFNFISTGGVGIHYFFRENTAFTLEGRYRHLSNAGIDHPNSGINTAFVLVGVTYRF
jgi:opacity protein-like surface antigen